jgi:DNA-damage-inducible protein J
MPKGKSLAMKKTANLNIRLNAEIKKTAESIYSRYGLSLAEAVTVFIHHSCNIGGLPFDLRPPQPNAETLAAMAEAQHISRDASTRGFRSMRELFESLENDSHKI